MARYTGPKIDGGVVYEALFSLSDADALTKLFELLYDVALLAEAGGGGGVPSGRLISTTAPLSGGGDLSANRTLSLLDDGVTYAKMQNVSAASKLLGRGDSGAGDPEEITLGANLTMTGTTLSAAGGAAAVGVANLITSDLTVPAGSSLAIPAYAEVADTIYVECAAGSYLEVG